MQHSDNEYQIDEHVDARGLRCPLPMLRTKKALANMEVGQLVQVVATDPSAKRDFDAMLKHTSHELMEYKVAESEFVFIIKRG